MADTDGSPADDGAPDPRLIVTREDFATHLGLAKQQAELSVRRLAKRTGIPSSTLGGYFTGEHLPALEPADQLDRILRAMGIDRRGDLALWRSALRRARRSSRHDTASAAPAVAYPAGAQLVSTQPPVRRLRHGPVLRGRDAVIDALTDTVTGRATATPRVRVLHGLGGSGKSSIALRVADIALAQRIPVFWLSAEDAAATSAGMYALAARIGVPADRLTRGSLPDTIWDRLAALPHRWLLVLDNADDPPTCLTTPRSGLTDGTGWLRPVTTPLGTVLVTTRDGDPATWAGAATTWLALHRLDGLGRVDGGAVLTDLAGSPAGTAEEAADLADRLGGHPMALMLAGRFLAESRTAPASFGDDAEPRTYREYLAALRRDGAAELLATGPDGRPAPGAGTTIARSCQFSLELLTRRGLVHARALLALLACLGTAPIPYTEVLRTRVLADSGLFPGLTTRALWQTLHALDDLGLITRTEADREQPEMLYLHPLARDIARLGARTEGRGAEYLRVLTELLAAALRGADVESPASWGRWRRLAGHCTALTDLLDPPPSALPVTRLVIDTAGRAAAYLRAAGQQAQAEHAFAVTLRACAGRLDDADTVRLDVEHNLARLYYDQRRYDEAEQLYRRVAAARHRVLGPDHGDTLTTDHYLARTLRTLDRLDEAGTLAEQTCATRERLFGARHPDTLTARHGLADLARVREDFTVAAELYAEIVTLRAEVLGDEHPAVLTTRQYRAETLRDLERTDEAEEEMRAVWVINQRVRGLDHPRTIVGGHALVDLLRANRSVGEAKALADVVLAAARRVFGETHPATLAIRFSDSLIHHEAGLTTSAFTGLAAVLSDREAVLGQQHPDTTATREIVEAIRHRIRTTRAGERAG